jgi:hypothetical protein
MNCWEACSMSFARQVRNAWSRSRTAVGRLLLWAVAIACGAVFATDASAAYYRVIYDYHTNRNDGIPYSNLFYTGVRPPYTFGRIEGAPARGPNPISGPGFGSTDVDKLYDMVPALHQYYVDKFGRNGPNGLGGAGDGVHQPYNYYSIYANSSEGTWLGALNVVQFKVGDATPEIMGHEMFHVVQKWTIEGFNFNVPGVDPSSYYHAPALAQFGSLIEGVSDFFGQAFERYVTGSTDWKSPYRSLADPSSMPDTTFGLISADHFFSPNYRQPSGGENFTYLNAGVINKASYLAVEGGFFNGVQVEGLGFDKIEQIWYHAVTDYFTPTETFALAYDHLLLSATDLYGPADAAKLQLALRAVELNGVAVPEPSSLALCVIGMVGFVGAYYRRRQSRAA